MQHMTKFSLTLFVLAAASLSQAADFEAYARVISVTPRVEQVNHPRQECHTEYVNVQRQQRSGDVSGGIIGGIVGGLLGNQVGGGNGRTAMTVVAAGAGAYADNEIEKNMKRTISYEIRVRMDDQTVRTFRSSQPEVGVGQRISVRDGRLVVAG